MWQSKLEPLPESYMGKYQFLPTLDSGFHVRGILMFQNFLVPVLKSLRAIMK